MPSVIQIRNVPNEIYRTLKARAALERMSLSDYILREIRQTAIRPSVDEMLERLRQLPPVELSKTPAEAVRAERDSR